MTKTAPRPVRSSADDDWTREKLEEVLSRKTVHLCIDMQRMFAEETDWRTPWMDRVLPVVESLVAHRPEATIFTRFLPPHDPDQVTGGWRRYFERWRNFTGSEMTPPGLVDLVPALQRYVPPATVFDKPVYSPFYGERLDEILREREIETLVVSGAETDVCVVAAVFDAVDRGYDVVLVKDAVCSSADETHDALITVYASRLSQQVTLVTSRDVIAAWQ